MLVTYLRTMLVTYLRKRNCRNFLQSTGASPDFSIMCRCIQKKNVFELSDCQDGIMRKLLCCDGAQLGDMFLNKESLWGLTVSWKHTRLLATHFNTVKEDEFVYNNHLVSSVSCPYTGYTADPWVWKSTECKICYISLCLETVLVSYFSGLHQHCNENKPKSKEATNATFCLLC